ncbi:unnamed protein product [Pleuronectes platessa]|uniref:Uncharacterized protein n=1 Tax=Pleuronectes platessa TaxID=8262 RepID=A0A9N7YA21_PLEPL|nr:unnamed protein product [Pleuronectes platessa]
MLHLTRVTGMVTIDSFAPQYDNKAHLSSAATESFHQHIAAGFKMQAGSVYPERHKQEAGIVYRNIPSPNGTYHGKGVEHGRGKILWDFKLQSEKAAAGWPTRHTGGRGGAEDGSGDGSEALEVVTPETRTSAFRHNI